MHCSLVDLSEELHLNIIQELLKHDDLLHEKSLESKYQKSHRERDDEFQHHRNLMNWSCTSRYYRNLLAPYIFRSVKLRNDEKSGASVDAVLKSPYGDLVKEIYFLGTYPSSTANPDNIEDDELFPGEFHTKSDDAEEEEEDAEKSIIITLPPIVDTLLSDLHQYPNLESLSIGFTYPYNSTFGQYYEPEGAIDNEVPTVALAFKALMTRTYDALSKKKVPQFKAVRIRKLIWTVTEPYESQAFRNFLSCVEHFSLSVKGERCWRIDTCNRYVECLERLGKLFFDHLASATSLNLRAACLGPIGLEDMPYARLALEKEQMTLLKSLHLEHVFICQELVDFVISHTDTLEQLTLHNWNCSINGSQTNDEFYWHHFFDALHSADLKQLSHLEIRPHNAPLTLKETMDRKSHRVLTEWAEPNNVQQIRRVLSADAKRHVFGYAKLDDRYSTCDEDYKENQAAFDRGEDQAAFDRLMGSVNANAVRGKGRRLPSR